jgi:hypothetical protein
MKAASAASSLERRSRRDTNSRLNQRLQPTCGYHHAKDQWTRPRLASDGFVNEQVFFLGPGAAVPFTLVALVDGTLTIAVGTWMFLTKREHAVVDGIQSHL